MTEVCRVNGGVYVKAGQFAAAFGSVPTEYRNRLALLQVRPLLLVITVTTFVITVMVLGIWGSRPLAAFVKGVGQAVVSSAAGNPLGRVIRVLGVLHVFAGCTCQAAEAI